ncbi:MAG: lipocalin family protein [Bacteroidota bacterium]|nr:lipocalin family protein [Bacteroidota bacterium]MDP4215294.1 lipocalin family protein [Bacteroidota bacterium]MDP4254280.1 lipocalin family protein [Bacteroidota bacterium]MDP4259154.1 lipocalin family protein [Bacteroidota bacterium]
MHLFRGFLIASICLLTFASLVSAQSIVGKWKRSTTKIFKRDKVTGQQVPMPAEYQKQFNAAAAANGYHETLEMKSDNTYTSSVGTAGAAPMVHQGTYTLTGKDLDMHVPLVKGEKTTITIFSLTNKEMVWDLLFMGKLTEVFYERI